MAKPQPKRIPSDDCEVSAGGETYQPHEGEWVDVRVGIKVGDLAAFEGLARLDTEVKALEGEPAGYAQQLRLVRELAEQLAPFLASRIAGWSWTDDDGAALPQPADDLAVFNRLHFQELVYLSKLIRDGEPDAEKNGSSGSPTTSLDTASAAIPIA